MITTIMMITVLTLLIVSLMRSVLLYIKANNQIIMQHQLFYEMELAVNQLDLTNKTCVVKNKTPNQVTLELFNQGCFLKTRNQTYTYLLDDLGLYPGLQVIINKKNYGTHHWLVTLATPQPHKVILQVRVAMQAEASLEVPAEHVIHQGIISWRHIERYTYAR